MKRPNLVAFLWIHSTVAVDQENFTWVNHHHQNLRTDVIECEDVGNTKEVNSRGLLSQAHQFVNLFMKDTTEKPKDKKKDKDDKTKKKDKKKKQKNEPQQSNKPKKDKKQKKADKKNDKAKDQEKLTKKEKKEQAAKKDKDKGDKLEKLNGKKKPGQKLNKKEKKQLIKENKDPNKNKLDHRAIRIRKKCQAPLNIYRTCYERVVDPTTNVDEDDFILRNPFDQPFIDHDEWMVADTMHLELTQRATEKGEELSCKDTLALEELGLKYLKDNIGGADTFSPICSLISESAIKNEVVNDGSGDVMQTIALKLDVVFAFKRHFADEIEQMGIRHGLRHLSVSRNLASCNRGGFGLCCSSKAFNSNSAKGSATCGGSGCGSSRCKKKKPKKKIPNTTKVKTKRPFRNLFESSTLPDLYEVDFDFVVSSYTEFAPEQTRGVLEAKSTDDVASCAVNRFIEDVLHVTSMTCQKYREYKCIKNEDLVPDAEDQACDEGIQTTDSNHTVTETTSSPTSPPSVCKHSDRCIEGFWDASIQACIYSKVDCSSYSQYHQCDPADGICKPVCSDDGDACTKDEWNESLNSCYTPVVCINGEACDPSVGCVSCDDADKCTADSWDSSKQVCVHTQVDCSIHSQYHQCDSSDGVCKPVCPDDGDKCTTDAWDESLKTCYAPVVCPENETCDSSFGCPSCPDNDKCNTYAWDYQRHLCVHTETDCSSLSEFHTCDLSDGICKPNCVDDNNMCTVDGWDEASNTCHIPVGTCPNGAACDPKTGCSCDDDDKCTTDSWDQVTNSCINNAVSCAPNESCEPETGLCKNDTMLVPCIAVIDEDNNDIRGNTRDWEQFRTEYPDRPFCLLIPQHPNYPSSNARVGIPDALWNDTKFQAYNVTRDEGKVKPDDWFDLCGLDKLGASSVKFVGIFVDESSSMYKSTVANSYNKFLQDLASANLKSCEVNNRYEEWIEPFLTDLSPDSGKCVEAVPTQTSTPTKIPSI